MRRRPFGRAAQAMGLPTPPSGSPRPPGSRKSPEPSNGREGGAGIGPESAGVARKVRTPAVVALVATALIGLYFIPTAAGDLATFRLDTIRSVAASVGPLALPTFASLWTLSGISLFGAVAYTAGWIRSATWGTIPAIFAIIAAFLIWAAAGQSLNLLGLLQSALIRAVPITLAALSGVLCERSGVINIAIEGMMLTSAFAAVVAAAASGSVYFGIFAAILIGVLMASVHGVLSIRYRVDQIVSGTVINIFALGITNYLSHRFLSGSAQSLNHADTLGSVRIPYLDQIPVLGPLLFQANAFIYIAVAMVVAVHIALFKTRFGLRLRAVGEHPRAADTLGINVYTMRYIGVLLGGLMAGLGGAYFTLGSVGRFDEQMTAGRGFIGLAAMIFGQWTPGGAVGASVLFGFADSLQTKLQILGIPIPSEFLLMAPYVVTIIVVAGAVGRRSVAPASIGQPYKPLD